MDAAASVGLCAVLAVVLGAFALLTLASGPRTFERLEREAPLPVIGKAPMEAVYGTITPVARLLAAMGVSANAVTLSSLALATAAAVCFALGHFGVGAAIACVAALADAIDGIVARESGTQSAFGKILDTTVDRYVEAVLLGGVAVFVRHSVVLLALVLAALVGGFMVSYASSVLRELREADFRAPMRRAQRLTILLAGATLVPFAASVAPSASTEVQLSPLIVALAIVASFGNATAVRRLLRGARAASRLRSPGAELRAEMPTERVTPIARRASAAPERLRHP